MNSLLAKAVLCCAVLLIASNNSRAEVPGVELDMTYTAEVWRVASGGIESGTAYLDNLDFVVDIDADELWGIPGTRFFAYGLYNNGAQFSERYVGDAQVVSNIETGVSAVRLYEAWLNVVLSERSDLLVGLYDLNSEFDVLDSSGLFIGSAHGIGTDIAQSGDNGPSIFPSTSLAVRLQSLLSENWTMRLAALDGVPGDPDNPGRTTIRLGGSDGALLIAEFQRDFGKARVLFGGWTYTSKVGGDERNWGSYLRGEMPLDSKIGDITAFGRVGIANEDVNPFSSFLSGGLTWRGFSEARPNDEAGIAFAWARTSDALGSSVENGELAIELTYRWQLNERFALQPDVQYIINPGLDPALDNALTFGLRFEAQIL